MADERRSVIVTFKKKEERADSETDKLELLSRATESRLAFSNAAAAEQGAMLGADPDELVYDVDEYEAPIVTASLTDGEIGALREDPNVAEVEDDQPMYAVGAHVDVSVGEAEGGVEAGTPGGGHGLTVEDQPSPSAETIPSGINQVKAPLGWDCSRGKSISVAVLDTGIAAKHPDLAPNYRGGASFVPSEPSPDDGHGHGTHCAGTIGAAINGAGVVGVAPAVSLYAGKVLSSTGGGNFSWLISALDWCIKRRIRIASMSLGAGSAPTAVGAMCDTAWKKGVLLVAAAGNTGGPVGFPAKYPSVIAVSAIDSSNTIAGFSCRGPEIELCAPGVNVLSTVPGGYGKMSGTSMACPHVSGAAAVAWGGHRWTKNVTIRRLLAWTADNLGIPGRDELYGYGRVDAAQAPCALTPPPTVPGIP